MATFSYKGRTNRGDSIEGNISAANADAVAAQLFNSGITPIDITEQAEKSADIKLSNLFGEKVGLDVYSDIQTTPIYYSLVRCPSQKSQCLRYKQTLRTKRFI